MVKCVTATSAATAEKTVKQQPARMASSAHADRESERSAAAGVPLYLQRRLKAALAGVEPGAAESGSASGETAKAEAPLALERPVSSVQRKEACPACSAAKGDAPCSACQGSEEDSEELEAPRAASQARRAAPSTDPAERQADALGSRIAADIPSPVDLRSGPLPPGVRATAERHLGESLEDVRIDAGASGNAKAEGERALAVTRGSEISFAAGEVSQTRQSAFVLGHELTHAAQQRRAGMTAVQRIPKTAETEGLKDAQKSELGMSSYLGQQGEEEKSVDAHLEKVDPSSVDRKVIVADIERKVRLRALAMMAAHRAEVLGARDRLVTQVAEEQKATAASGAASGPGAAKKESALDVLRRAAQVVQRLKATEGQLEDSRSAVKVARSQATQGSDIDDVVRTITSQPLLTSDVRSSVAGQLRVYRDTGARAHLWGAASSILELRAMQISGMREAVRAVYKGFPLFATFDFDVVPHEEPPPLGAPPTPAPAAGVSLPAPAPPGQGGAAADAASRDADVRLKGAMEEAYAELVGKIDNAIALIASGDIHALDLPAPVNETKAALRPDVRAILDEELQTRAHEDFLLKVAQTAVAALSVLAPVIGPALAAIVAVADLGMAGKQLSDVLVARDIAAASTDPYGESPVGLDAPGTFETVMVAVGFILSAFGCAAAFRQIRTGVVGEEFGAMLEDAAAARSRGGAGGPWKALAERGDSSVVIQGRNFDCGPASCEMLLESRGIKVSQEELAKGLGPDLSPRLGTTTENLHKLLQKFDPAEGDVAWRLSLWNPSSPGEVAAAIQQNTTSRSPWVALMYSGGDMGHFIVIEGRTPSGLLIVKDPWEGTMYFLTERQFAKYWTGDSLARDISF